MIWGMWFRSSGFKAAWGVACSSPSYVYGVCLRVENAPVEVHKAQRKPKSL